LDTTDCTWSVFQSVTTSDCSHSTSVCNLIYESPNLWCNFFNSNGFSVYLRIIFTCWHRSALSGTILEAVLY
jgi:hypothetical protein